MLLDVVNGAISKDVMDRLKRARLVAHTESKWKGRAPGCSWGDFSKISRDRLVWPGDFRGKLPVRMLVGSTESMLTPSPSGLGTPSEVVHG